MLGAKLAYLAMKFGNLVSATSERKMMRWGWNRWDTVSEQEEDRNRPRMGGSLLFM